MVFLRYISVCKGVRGPSGQRVETTKNVEKFACFEQKNFAPKTEQNREILENKI